jgi:hypothetical protein
MATGGFAEFDSATDVAAAALSERWCSSQATTSGC